MLSNFLGSGLDTGLWVSQAGDTSAMLPALARRGYTGCRDDAEPT